MTRPLFIGGNWKCNGTSAKVIELVDMLNNSGDFSDSIDVVVAPPAIHIGSVLKTVRSDVHVAIQNCWSEPNVIRFFYRFSLLSNFFFLQAGAWTGEITPDLIKDFGVKWVILGHSERRVNCNETNEIVAKKVRLALEAGLKTIACIGEKLIDRQLNRTFEVCYEQIKPILAAVPGGKLNNLVIAYEPVWAIGTGVTPTPLEAQNTHLGIRKWIADNVSSDAANNLRIIYGGSVNRANCESLICMNDIDGFLIGGASLKNDFTDIIAICVSKSKL